MQWVGCDRTGLDWIGLDCALFPVARKSCGIIKTLDSMRIHNKQPEKYSQTDRQIYLSDRVGSSLRKSDGLRE